MLILKVALATGILSSTALAKLFIPPKDGRLPKFDNVRLEFARSELEPALASRSSTDLPAFKMGQHTVKEQNDTVCATRGEKQWSGTVDVTDHRRLFYYFFESRNDPEHDPIVLWIQGGPGSSSMYGLFTEMGPCTLPAGQDKTTVNEWAWNNNASLLFIDQPAGVGFSSVSDDEFLPTGDADGAEDFQVFLNVFFTKIFPKKAHLSIHFAAESYGGHYAPTYVKHIFDSRRYNGKNAFQGNISSIILVNALIELPVTNLGSYELLCVSENGKGILNQTACNALRDYFPECWSLRQACLLTNDPFQCGGALDYCGQMQQYYTDTGRDNYDIHHKCTDQACTSPTEGNYTAYLNQPQIIASLGFPKDFKYANFNPDIAMKYQNSGALARPMLNDIGSVLDTYKTPKIGDIKLLVLNGNDDFLCNTPGNKIAYDELRWSGQADYRSRPWAKLPEGLQAKGEWKGTRDGRLVFVAVDGAGHMVPHFVSEGSYRILEKWIQGGWRE